MCIHDGKFWPPYCLENIDGSCRAKNVQLESPKNDKIDINTDILEKNSKILTESLEKDKQNKQEKLTAVINNLVTYTVQNKIIWKLDNNSISSYSAKINGFSFWLKKSAMEYSDVYTNYDLIVKDSYNVIYINITESVNKAQELEKYAEYKGLIKKLYLFVSNSLKIDSEKLDKILELF